MHRAPILRPHPRPPPHIPTRLCCVKKSPNVALGRVVCTAVDDARTSLRAAESVAERLLLNYEPLSGNLMTLYLD